MSEYRQNHSWVLLREFGRLRHNLNQINRAVEEARESVELTAAGAQNGGVVRPKCTTKRKRVDKALAEANGKLAKSVAKKEKWQLEVSGAAARVAVHGEVLLISYSDYEVFLKIREEHGFDGHVCLAKWNQMELIAEKLDEMGIKYSIV